MPRKPDGVHVAAVVNDVLVDLGDPAGVGDADATRLETAKAAERNHLRLILVGCWLCHEPSLRQVPGYTVKVRRWLLEGLKPVAPLVVAELFVTDAERREELARALLQAVEVTPSGETAHQAADRLKALSTVERHRVLRETEEARKRAQALRDRMSSPQATESASRYGSE